MSKKRKNNIAVGQPMYAEAVKRYRNESGDLFKPPSEKHSTFERGAWLLSDKTELVAIVPATGEPVLFHDWLRGYMTRIALGSR